MKLNALSAVQKTLITSFLHSQQKFRANHSQIFKNRLLWMTFLIKMFLKFPRLDIYLNC